MGRSAPSSGRTRSTTATITTTHPRCDQLPDGQSEVPTFPRRSPKQGTAYQTKVPKWTGGESCASSTATYRSNRPAPLPVSRDAPHRTLQEVEENKIIHDVDNKAPLEPAVAATTTIDNKSPPLLSLGYERTSGSGKGKTRRLQAPENRDYVNFVRPLFGPPPHQTTTSLHQQQQQQQDHGRAWLDRVVTWHETTTQARAAAAAQAKKQPTNTSARQRKSRYKRTREEAAPAAAASTSLSSSPSLRTITIPLPVFDKNSNDTTKKKKRAAAPAASLVEEPNGNGRDALDSYIVQHGRKEHHTVAQDRLDVLIQLTGGQAVRSFVRASKRRKLEILKNKDKKLPPLVDEEHEGELDWRTRVLTWCEGLQGDLRTRGGSNSLLDAACAPMESLCVDEDDDDASILLAWRAILRLGRAMERQLQEGKEPLQLSYVFMVVKQAAVTLPRLEEDFVDANDDAMRDEDERPLSAHSIDECMQNLLDVCQKTRLVRAKLFDVWHCNGAELDLVRKLLEAASRDVLQWDELPEMQRQYEQVLAWQTSVDQALLNRDMDMEATNSDNHNDLGPLEELVNHARECHGFRCKGLVLLEAKLDKAYELRDRILLWQRAGEAGKTEPLRVASAVVRDIHRLKLRFPEANKMLAKHRAAETWVERATVAIRSRISLPEIKALLETADQDLSTSVDLTEYLEKLRTREELAETWLESLREVLPLPSEDADGEILLAWMREAREQLEGGNALELHDLACEGSRITVEIDYVKLLQVELDARNWSSRAKRWIPNTSMGDTALKGKLEELKEHMEKASLLRERLTLPARQRDAWVLEGEEEIERIVESADAWLTKFKSFQDGEVVRSPGRSCFTMDQLREFVLEGQAVHAQLGWVTPKMSKILSNAEDWHNKYSPLLQRCGVFQETDGQQDGSSEKENASLQELRDAVKASSELNVDLDEAVRLETLLDRVESWFDRANIAVGAKKPPRKKKALTTNDLYRLIEEASSLPVDTDKLVRMMREQLTSVNSWQEQAGGKLLEIVEALDQLREAITAAHGDPAAFNRETSMAPSEAMSVDLHRDENGCIGAENISEEMATEDQPSNCGAESMPTPEMDLTLLTRIQSVDGNVHVLVKSLYDEAQSHSVDTPEGEIAAHLERLSRWSVRSVKYLESSREVFDKRFFGAFDRFVKEGKDISEQKLPMPRDVDLQDKLTSSWGGIVADQLGRLQVLLTEREAFVLWCEQAEQLLSRDDRRISIDKLREVADTGRKYSTENDFVARMDQLAEKKGAWIANTKAHLDDGEKLSMNMAKSLLDEGNRIGVQSEELRCLRNGIKAARSWAARVKKCSLDQFKTQVSDVNELLDEHDDLIVEMPEEVARLSRAMKNHCICRRTHDGLMIQCDECREKFHVPCVGMSQSRAEKVDKYICVRCSLKKVYKSNAQSIVGVLRKWTCERDLKKARAADAQKHQRKVRKETKDLEHFKKEYEATKAAQERISAAETAASVAAEPEAAGAAQENVAVFETAATVLGGNEAAPDITVVVDMTAPAPGEGDAARAIQGSVVVAETATSDPNASIVNAASELETTAVRLSSMSALAAAKPATASVPASSVNAAAELAKASTPPAPVDMAAEAATASKLHASLSTEIEPSVSTIPTEPANAPVNGVTEFSVAPVPSVETITAATTASPQVTREDPETIDPAALAEKLTTLAESIRLAEARINSLAEIAKQRKIVLKSEDEQSIQLRRWSIRVRSLVIAPSTKQAADMCRPTKDGSPSAAMIGVLEDAKRLGLGGVSDVTTVATAFKNISWCLRAFDVLSRQPFHHEIESIVRQAAELKVPDDKALRMLRSMNQKAKSWQTKVKHALLPTPGSQTPYKMDELQRLARLADDIPLSMPFESRLHSVIEDSGARHCLCCGPSDGRFMLGCDRCEVWYHGHCVGVSNSDSENLEEWICPKCRGSPPEVSSLAIDMFHEKYDVVTSDDDDDDDSENHDICPKAPTPKNVWPPFGLLNTESAKEALGQELSGFPDDVGDLTEEVPETMEQIPVAAETRSPEQKEAITTILQVKSDAIQAKPAAVSTAVPKSQHERTKSNVPMAPASMPVTLVSSMAFPTLGNPSISSGSKNQPNALGLPSNMLPTNLSGIGSNPMGTEQPPINQSIPSTLKAQFSDDNVGMGSGAPIKITKSNEENASHQQASPVTTDTLSSDATTTMKKSIAETAVGDVLIAPMSES